MSNRREERGREGDISRKDENRHARFIREGYLRRAQQGGEPARVVQQRADGTSDAGRRLLDKALPQVPARMGGGVGVRLV
jgi:hypothetical protein